MSDKINQKALAELLRSVDGCNSIDDLGKALDSFGVSFPYQILHIGIGRIDNVTVKEVVYSRPSKETGIGAADFEDNLKWAVLREAMHAMKPFDLMQHEFQTEDTGLFYHLRELLSSLGVEGIMVMPFQIDNTIAVMIINCPLKEYSEHIHSILPAAYQILTAIFKRFPTLAKWPTELKLSQREAEVLQLTANGMRESEIAAELDISINTVRNHVQNCKTKLDARNKLHAVSIATRAGEINPTAASS